MTTARIRSVNELIATEGLGSAQSSADCEAEDESFLTPLVAFSAPLTTGSTGPEHAREPRDAPVVAARVLLADPDPLYRTAIDAGLSREGFTIQLTSDGRHAVELFEESPFDVVLLALDLPGMAGLDVCRHIRSTSWVPIIVITERTAVVDAVVALELGADDFIRKPFRLREFVARTRAVMRRGTEASGVPRSVSAILEAHSVRLDRERHEVEVRGKSVFLPVKEFRLLEVLLGQAGRIVKRADLIEAVWGSDYAGDPNILDVHIRRLRVSIEEDPSEPKLITTIRGLGYRCETRPLDGVR